MGFDISIQMMLHMCPDTGKPYYYKRDKKTKKLEKIYDFPDIVVPGKMCEYLVRRGHIFHAYTHTFNEREVYDVTVEQFLETFPSWEDVMMDANYDDEGGWLEEDHIGFQETLEWLAQQPVTFRVSWSY